MVLAKGAGGAVGATAAGAEAVSVQLLPLQQTRLGWQVLVPLSRLAACLPLLLARARQQQLWQLRRLPQVAQQASRLALFCQRLLRAAGAAEEARAEAGVPLLAGAAHLCTAAAAWALSYPHLQPLQVPVPPVALVEQAVLVSKLPVGVAEVAEAAGAAGRAGVRAGPSA
jgi:hypothetical protein